MLAKFSSFNISGYALTNVTFSYQFALKKCPVDDCLLDLSDLSARRDVVADLSARRVADCLLTTNHK